MTPTDSRSSRLDMIESASRGLTGKSSRAAIASVLIIIALLFALKSTAQEGKHKSSAVAQQVAPNDIVRARWPLSCSADFALSFISRPTGCENSLVQAPAR